METAAFSGSRLLHINVGIEIGEHDDHHHLGGGQRDAEQAQASVDAGQLLDLLAVEEIPEPTDDRDQGRRAWNEAQGVATGRPSQ